MNETQARDEICRIGQSLFARGYAHATAGNISVRLEPEHGGGFLITPTDACLGSLDPTQLARLDDQCVQISGSRASKTIALHQRIYRETARSGVPACTVLHTHSTHLVALSLLPTAASVTTGELLPALTPYYLMKVGRVPRIPYHYPGSAAAAEAVAQAIISYAERGIRLCAVMLDRLGPNIWHQSPAQAMSTLEELEETAKLWLVTRQAAELLDEAAVAELVKEFDVTW